MCVWLCKSLRAIYMCVAVVGLRATEKDEVTSAYIFGIGFRQRDSFTDPAWKTRVFCQKFFLTHWISIMAILRCLRLKEMYKICRIDFWHCTMLKWPYVWTVKKAKIDKFYDYLRWLSLNLANCFEKNLQPTIVNN